MLRPRSKLAARRLIVVEEAVNRFLLHICRLSPSTQAAYGRAIGRFCKDYAPKYLEDLIREDIERFLLDCRKNHRATTCNLYLSALRAWGEWIEAEYGIPNPFKRVRRLKILPPHQRILTKKEYQAVIAATNGYERETIMFIANSGLRCSEYLSLRRENIDSKFITIIGKGDKQRRIPLNTTLRSILSNPTFDFPKSRSRKWLLRLCYKAAKAAEIPKFSPHSLRHFFASELHSNGVSINLIGKLLGHSCPLVTTSIYIHWQDSELVGATDCLS